jgi:RNA recognition motif-containing protein
MENKLYVGNLSYDTTEESLRSFFSGAGTVTSVSLIKDRESGRSKGFAFVEMSSQNEAEEAIKTLDGVYLDNRQIKVNKARPQEKRPRSDYGDRGGRGGGGSYGKSDYGGRDRKRRGSGGGYRRDD